MPVYKMLTEMPYDEYIRWMAYFNARPVGWRDDSRAFKLMQAQGVKGNPHEFFDSLRRIHESATANSSSSTGNGYIATTNLKNSPLFSRMMSAVGGDKITL